MSLSVKTVSFYSFVDDNSTNSAVKQMRLLTEFVKAESSWQDTVC